MPVETLHESERNVTSLADKGLLAGVLRHVRLEQTRPLEHFVAVRATDRFLLILRTIWVIVTQQPMVQFHVILELLGAGEKFLTLHAVMVEVAQNGCVG